MNSLESMSPPAPAQATPATPNSEERYAHLIERVGYGVYRSTPDGRFTEVNSALARMLGYDSAQELFALDIGRDVYLEPQERDRLRARPIAEAQQDWVSTRWKRRDGSAISVRLSIIPFMVDGELAGYDGLVEDITERQRHEELLRRSERMASIGTTLAGVAHELNNPLAAIMGFAQLLLKKPWPSEDRAALETINHEAIRSATIVKDLLALTRKREVERRGATDINDIVGYIVRTRRYALETTGVSCRVELEPTLPCVFGDRAQLEQVVLNLLTNAEQALHSISDTWHHPSPPQVTIRTRIERDQVAIDIEDNGPGIPENIQSKIWDPFWTTKDEGEGTGLGLSVVHSIVVDHGGTISLEAGLARGARFIVHLPISKTLTPETNIQASQPLDVLMVDPAAGDLGFVEKFLTGRGHAVINAHTGELALRLAEQTSFDAVLCDAQLLDRDGVPLAAALRATRGCAKATFVLALSNPADDRAARALLEDATIMARPYDVDALRRHIEGD